MKDYKRIAAWAIEIATFFFAAFGGFLTRIAPPDQTGASYAVGTLSFLVLIALLVVSALGRAKASRATRKRWIVGGVISFLVALPAVLLYYQAWQENTYSFPPERPLQQHVRGLDTDLTALARRWILEHPAEASPADLEANLPYNQIWKQESIIRANRLLLLTYGWMVLSLATAMFCLVEANASALTTRRKTGAVGGKSGTPTDES
ncbi:MAG: hypothetical protein ABSH39_24170 [Candidatus Acidiferrum sp.]